MNLATLRRAVRTPELRQRILVVLGLLVIYRILAYVPVPVPDNEALNAFLQRLFNSSQLLGFANLFSGGALTNFSITMMSIGPFINASIIIQLMTRVIPHLESLSKEGERGRQKINQYTRLLTLPLAIGQSIAMVVLIRQTAIQSTQTDLIGNATPFQWFLMVTTMTAGTMLLMWIGELITEKGIGNGISLIIFASIAASLPAGLGQFVTLAQGDSGKIITLIGYVAASLAVLYALVKLNEGVRAIPVSYARRVRGSRIYSGLDTHLPIRVITAGIIPIIFALAFLAIPPFLGQLLANSSTPWVASLAADLSRWFAAGHLVYSIAYFVLVVGFTYFYTSIVFNPKEISENMQKQGGFIPGVRPGRETANYLGRVVRRITLAGSVALGAIAILPFVAQGITHTQALTLGGTSLVIIVSVALETVKQLESRALTTNYDQYK